MNQIKNLSKVSVLMPVYNGGKTLMLAINSLLKQTYANWICIIVNDGSTDNTKSLLDGITDERFKIIHLEKNKGRAFARQVCLDNSKGDFISFLDADDFYHPEKLEMQVNAFTQNLDIVLVGCGMLSMKDSYEPISMRGMKVSNEFIYYNEFDKTKFFPPSVMIKREKALEMKYNYYLNAGEDNDFFSRYLLNSTYFLLDKVYYYYLEDLNIPLKKIIPYYYFEFVREVLALPFNLQKFPKQFKNVFTAFSKLVYITFTTPFIGSSSLISRRGNQLSQLEKDRFSIVKTELIK